MFDDEPLTADSYYDKRPLLTPEQCREFAKENNLEIVPTSSHLLLLDLDGVPLVNATKKRLLKEADWLAELGLIPAVFGIEFWESRSGSGTHVVVHCDANMTFERRLLTASLLGSDPKHTRISAHRHYALGEREEDALVLFKPLTEPTTY